ncbi:GNAT family N-acetyltransferase [Rhizobium sp. FKY42]|uniref:GNAT family N-acetyltransferase n=1 Tax=Rhizobium sp. FKY42 TaxID=2562310 RepID=UPI0010C0C830|nr:GNAT family N-acetyltransferase [Rhizobium sp. FKY42]
MTEFRKAEESDLAAIIGMLADDALGRTREVVSDPVDRRYVDAFAAIEADTNQYLAVAVDDAGDVVGCLQISFLPGLSRLGLWRGQIESVRVAASQRGKGVGREMISWAVEECRKRGCGTVQLTSDNRREDAHRFYENLGFEKSHAGFKLTL